MSKVERRTVAATMATTSILIGVILVALYLSLRGYVIHLGAWPA